MIQKVQFLFDIKIYINFVSFPSFLLILGTFRPERIKAIAARFGIDQEAALENILFARAFTSEHQMELLIELTARFAEEKGVYRLLVF